MSLKSDCLLKRVIEVKSVKEINAIKPEIVKYLKRDILKENIKNSVIVISLVAVFISLLMGS